MNPFVANDLRDFLFGRPEDKGLEYGYRWGKYVPVSWRGRSLTEEQRKAIAALNTPDGAQEDPVKLDEIVFGKKTEPAPAPKSAPAPAAKVIPSQAQELPVPVRPSFSPPPSLADVSAAPDADTRLPALSLLGVAAPPNPADLLKPSTPAPAPTPAVPAPVPTASVPAQSTPSAPAALPMLPAPVAPSTVPVSQQDIMAAIQNLGVLRQGFKEVPREFQDQLNRLVYAATLTPEERAKGNAEIKYHQERAKAFTDASNQARAQANELNQPGARQLLEDAAQGITRQPDGTVVNNNGTRVTPAIPIPGAVPSNTRVLTDASGRVLGSSSSIPNPSESLVNNLPASEFFQRSANALGPNAYASPEDDYHPDKYWEAAMDLLKKEKKNA